MGISTTLEYTPLEEIDKIYSELQAGFRSHKTKSTDFRKFQLLQLAYLIKDNISRFEEAYQHDLGRGKFEAHFLEVNSVYEEVLYHFRNVDKLSKPDSVPFSMNFTLMKSRVYKEPKGVVLVVGSYNYPFYVALNPMIGAMSAGCAVVLKPSEQTPAISSLLTELFPKYLDPSLYRVVNGGISEMTRLLELRWDHLMFTGSGKVGRIVASAAGKTLTPVTLELGGKSPVFIDPTCDIAVTARRLIWGTFVNGGQTCVAPDYALVPRAFLPKFVEAIKQVYAEMYSDPKTAIVPLVSPQAFKRIEGLLKTTKGNIILGGECNESAKFVSPAVVIDVPKEDPLMEEEIFGPIFPIVTVENEDEALAFVNSRDHPLALYVFSQDSKYKEKIRKNTMSGAITFNDVVIYVAIPGTPFGGVGPSGYGGYHHNQHGFNTFTHLRTAVDNPYFTDIILRMRYPPFNKKKERQALKLAPSLPRRAKSPEELASRGWRKWIILSLAALVAAFFVKRRKLIGN